MFLSEQNPEHAETVCTASAFSAQRLLHVWPLVRRVSLCDSSFVPPQVLQIRLPTHLPELESYLTIIIIIVIIIVIITIFC